MWSLGVSGFTAHLILNRTGTTKDNSLLASRAGGGGIGCARLSMARVSASSDGDRRRGLAIDPHRRKALLELLARTGAPQLAPPRRQQSTSHTMTARHIRYVRASLESFPNNLRLLPGRPSSPALAFSNHFNTSITVTFVPDFIPGIEDRTCHRAVSRYPPKTAYIARNPCGRGGTLEPLTTGQEETRQRIPVLRSFNVRSMERRFIKMPGQNLVMM
jgi:hypothetical protein